MTKLNFEISRVAGFSSSLFPAGFARYGCCCHQGGRKLSASPKNVKASDDSLVPWERTITADALLTQRALALYLVEKRKAHYHFTVKNNQKLLLKEIESFFENVHWEPNYTIKDKVAHGREEIRNIRVTSELNQYLNFPHVGQAFKVERLTRNKKNGKKTQVIAYGITSKTPGQATAEQVLEDNREHWSIENSCHYIIDWNYDEDRSRISKGYGPENMTRLRRFAVGLLKSKGVKNVAQKMR